MVLLKEVISHEQIRRGGLLRESCTREPYYLQMGPLKEGHSYQDLGFMSKKNKISQIFLFFY